MNTRVFVVTGEWSVPIKVKSYASVSEPVVVKVRRPTWQQFISY